MPQMPRVLSLLLFTLAALATAPARAEEAALSSPASFSYEVNGTRLDAERISIDVANQAVNAEGGVVISSPRGAFHALNARYSLCTGVGALDGAYGEFGKFKFKAGSMTIDARNLKHAQQISLTTCDKTVRPHFAMVVRDFIVYPNNRFEARNAGLMVNGHRVITFPYVKGDLSEKSPSFEGPDVKLGVSHIDGVYAEGSWIHPLGRTADIAVNARVGTRGEVRGIAEVSMPFSVGRPPVTGKIALIASRREDIVNRLVDGNPAIDDTLRVLTIDRLPALVATTDAIPLRRGADAVTVKLGGSLGRFHEEPTDVTRHRAQLWGVAATPRFRLGRSHFDLYAQAGARGANYEGGDQHTTLITQLTLESRPEDMRYLNISYLHRNAWGTTPFLFDEVHIPDELYTEVELPITRKGNWRIGAWNRHDLDRGVSRNYHVNLIYHQDCLSYGLSYDHAARGISLGVVLNAFGSFRRGGIGPVAFSQ